MEHMPMSAPEKVVFQEAIAVRDVGVCYVKAFDLNVFIDISFLASLIVQRRKLNCPDKLRDGVCGSCDIDEAAASIHEIDIEFQ